MLRVRLPSSTMLSGQTCRMISSLSMGRPLFATRTARISKTLEVERDGIPISPQPAFLKIEAVKAKLVLPPPSRSSD